MPLLRYQFDINHSHRASFRRDGYLIIRGAVTHDLLDSIREQVSTEFGDDLAEIGSVRRGRVQDAWHECSSVAELAGLASVLEILRNLYGEEPHPFQTLTFSKATEQHAHSDDIHFSSDPKGFMCGVWVAIEDVNETNGPLFYYPGSHTLPYMSYRDFDIDVGSLEQEPDAYREYETRIRKFVEDAGFQKEIFIAKKGDLIVWSANLVHGGSPVTGSSSSRWSQVTHYLFDDCLHYTPRLSYSSEALFVRQHSDICTGEPIRSLSSSQFSGLQSALGKILSERDEAAVELQRLKALIGEDTYLLKVIKQRNRARARVKQLEGSRTFRFATRLNRLLRRTN